jgi:3-oxoacyl-[acyl-carrier protein] reductase
VIALVTGASRGIGAAIARQLAADGMDVAIVYRREQEQAEAVAAACRQSGVRALAFQADIASETGCRGLLDQVREQLGPVQVLVNNAGITRDGLCMRMSRDQFTAVLDANLTGTFLMCRFVLPDMVKARSGRIINMTSAAGVHGNAGQVNYAASKAGVIGLTLSLAKEWHRAKSRSTRWRPALSKPI